LTPQKGLKRTAITSGVNDLTSFLVSYVYDVMQE